MEELNDKQVNERFLKAYKNRRYITTLNPTETIAMIELVEKLIGMIEEQRTKVVVLNPKMKDYDIDNIIMSGCTHKRLKEFKTELEQHLAPNKTEQKSPLLRKKKDGKPVPRHYAIYHYINETYNDLSPVLQLKGKKEISKFGQERYSINGLQFYNAYNKIRSDKIKIISYLNRMDQDKLQRLQNTLFEISKIFNDVKFVEWWNLTILKKV